jgi:hypothetical protein
MVIGGMMTAARELQCLKRNLPLCHFSAQIMHVLNLDLHDENVFWQWFGFA